VIKALMLGAGHTALERKLSLTEDPVDEWVSLDMNPEAKPDILFNLEWIESWNIFRNYIPVDNESFDEIHAYDVLEHFGTQGNYKGFFRGWREFWRILKPGGALYGICPRYDTDWAWGDPGHTRVITSGTLGYLTREMYEDLGQLPQTDYRRFVRPCWWSCPAWEYTEAGFRFTMRKTP
jgi:SAM-dependent methyltransferase